MPEQRILDFYVEQSVMTRPGPYGTLFDDLPADVAELVEIVQGLLVYEDVASGFYGFELPAERGLEKHLRTVEAMLERLLVLDDRPLAQPRPVERRLAGRCHHFMVLLLSMMRAKNIPSRARCGFGAYFDPGYYEDHWVVEYWNAHEQQWVLVDPQFDDVWRQLQIQHNILDVPRDQFLVAADAWNLCVRDAADPARFGAVFADLYGLCMSQETWYARLRRSTRWSRRPGTSGVGSPSQVRNSPMHNVNTLPSSPRFRGSRTLLSMNCRSATRRTNSSVFLRPSSTLSCNALNGLCQLQHSADNEPASATLYLRAPGPLPPTTLGHAWGVVHHPSSGRCIHRCP